MFQIISQIFGKYWSVYLPWFSWLWKLPGLMSTVHLASSNTTTFGFRQARAETPMLAFSHCVSWGKSLRLPGCCFPLCKSRHWSTSQGLMRVTGEDGWRSRQCMAQSRAGAHEPSNLPLPHPTSSVPRKSLPPPSALHLHSPSDLPSDLSLCFLCLNWEGSSCLSWCRLHPTLGWLFKECQRVREGEAGWVCPYPGEGISVSLEAAASDSIARPELGAAVS